MIGTVALVGLGQIGSSLGAAIRERRLARRVLGVARREAVRRKAVRIRAVHEATGDLSAVSAADVVILATPVLHILQTLPAVVREMKPNALLTDVGSTKSEIVKRVRTVRGRTGTKPFGFIGGHPMAGTEKAGIEGCDPDLFAGRPYILIPAGTCFPKHRTCMGALAKGLGARVHWMDSPAEHDRIVAAVSHLPHLLAYSLMETAGDGVFLSLAGGSYRDATRVSQSPPEMVLDFLLTNRKSLPAVSRSFQKTLKALTAAVSRGDRRLLRSVIDRARRRRCALD